MTLKAIAEQAGVTLQRVTHVDPLPEPDATQQYRKVVTNGPLKDRPKRKCSNCGRTFQPTVQRRMLCASCYRRGDPDGEE